MLVVMETFAVWFVGQSSALWVFVLAIGCSWIGTDLWSSRQSLHAGAQLLVPTPTVI